MKNTKAKAQTAAPPAEAVRDGRSTRHDDRRRELMDAAVAYVMREGLAKLSIRPMAEALGISHQTLLHHFGSKEQMVARVLTELHTRSLADMQQRAQNKGLDPLGTLDAGWKQISAPESLPFCRAYFEIHAIATSNPEQYADFLASVIKPWLAIPVRFATDAGMSPARAEAFATMVQATSRGLLIDLLTTGEQRRVDSAYALLRSVVQAEFDAAGAMKGKPKAKPGAKAKA